MTELIEGVTCIIPAYNEGARIANVLEAVRNHPMIFETLVIDDGSSDNTSQIVEASGAARLVRLGKNGGKTRALGTGIAEARTTHLLFLDADLRNLEADDISALIEPVLNGRANISISLRENAPRIWRWIGLDYISGERVLRRDMVSDRLEDLDALPSFGFEVYLNALCLAARSRIAIVHWSRVQSPFKNSKYGFWVGIGADFSMMRDIVRTVPVYSLLWQIIRMRQLRV